MTTPASISIRSVSSTQGRRSMATCRGERRSSSAASEPAMRKMSSDASSWTTSMTSSTVMVPTSRFWSSTTGTVTRSYLATTRATSSRSIVALTLTTSSSRRPRSRLRGSASRRRRSGTRPMRCWWSSTAYTPNGRSSATVFLMCWMASSTVEDAIQHIRKSVTEERPFGVYAVDDHQHLIGRVPLRRLLLADPRSLLLGLLEEDVVSVNATMDREEVARVVAKYDLVTVPVVDDQNRLVGTITVDDVMDVVQEEASEDIFRMAGSDAAELERRSPRQVAMLRLPWVLLTLLIEMLAGVVIHYFDKTLGKVILLASFMPVIQAISGNTGLQSVTMIVRGLATGQVQLVRWWEPLWRQIQTSMIIGAVCAVVVGLIGLLWHSSAFALVVAISMFESVNLSGFAW